MYFINDTLRLCQQCDNDVEKKNHIIITKLFDYILLKLCARMTHGVYL